MASADEFLTESANLARYQPGQLTGHYESYFLRANHPSRPLALWVRYTLFQPKGLPEQAIGELWAIHFDGETGQHLALREELPIAACHFDRCRFDVRVGDATLQPERATGELASRRGILRWDLHYAGQQPPLFLLPNGMYEGGFPKAKALVGMPLAAFNGVWALNQRAVSIEDWAGSQNHNWGSRHTDRYAWGQVAGFDNAPDSFFEIGTARLKYGPFWTPQFTVMVLRHEGKEYALNGLLQSLRASASVHGLRWSFASENGAVRIAGTITATEDGMMGLAYRNPSGGIKHCLNSMIASCELAVTLKQEAGGPKILLWTASRAAFEILTDDPSHGVAIRA